MNRVAEPVAVVWAQSQSTSTGLIEPVEGGVAEADDGVGGAGGDDVVLADQVVANHNCNNKVQTYLKVE